MSVPATSRVKFGPPQQGGKKARKGKTGARDERNRRRRTLQTLRAPIHRTGRQALPIAKRERNRSACLICIWRSRTAIREFSSAIERSKGAWPAKRKMSTCCRIQRSLVRLVDGKGVNRDLNALVRLGRVIHYHRVRHRHAPPTSSLTGPTI